MFFAENKKIKIWDLKNNKQIKILGQHKNNINCLCLSLNKKILYSGSDDKTIKIWDLIYNKEIGILGNHDDSVFFIFVSL